MRSADALAAFKVHLRSRELTVDDLDASSAIAAMLTFYAGSRAGDVVPGPDGDMLLFQWAYLKRRPEPSFEFDITRQLIVSPGDGDDDIWQLSLSLYFPLDDQNVQLGQGHRWYHAPDPSEEFADYIDAHPATVYAAAHRPARAELKWGSV